MVRSIAYCDQYEKRDWQVFQDMDNASREVAVCVTIGQRNRCVHGRRNPVLGARRSIGIVTILGTVRLRREQYFEGQDGDGDERAEESSAPELMSILKYGPRTTTVRDADTRCTIRLGSPMDESLIPVDYRSRDKSGTVSALSIGPILLPRKQPTDIAKIDRACHSDVRKLE
jgi:hypothetical protein